MVFLLVMRITGWKEKIHKIAFGLATRNLDSKAIKDLEDRAALLELPGKTDYLNLASIMDAWRTVYRFPLLNKIHFNKEKISKFAKYEEMEKSGLMVALYSCHKQLGGSVRSYFLDTFALILCAHLLGDVHQPFHVHPDGGKRICNGCGYRDLHEFWDYGCGVFEGRSVKEAVEELTNEFANYDFSGLLSFDKEALKTNPVETLGSFLNSVFDESMLLAKEFLVYSPEVAFHEIYVEDCQERSKVQIYKAGIRLRTVLRLFYEENKELVEE